MVDSLPNLVNSPQANKAIIQAIKAKNRLNQEMANVIYRYEFGGENALTYEQAGQELYRLQNQSVMTPELKAQLQGLRGIPANTSTAPAATPNSDGWSVVNGVKIRVKQ